MSVGNAIYARLKAVSGVTDLVGTGDSARIYPGELPPAPTYPAITFRQVSAPRTHAMGADTGDVHARVEVKSWAPVYEDAASLAAAVRLALSRWGPATSGGVVVEHVFLDNEISTLEERAIVDGRKGVEAFMQDYLVHFAE